MSDISDRRTDLPPRAIGVPDTGQGLFQKFEVRRTDGSSEPGGKHEGCEYFVLDTDHDPHARAALSAYADACEATHPLLARDLRQRHHLEALPEPDYLQVPILERFDQAKPIGWVRVRRDSLPPTPSWCFSLGYEVLQAKRTGITRLEVTDYRLHAVSITSDDEYERVIDREKGRLLTEPTEHVVQKLRERAIGIARDVADAFAKRRNDGSSTETLFVRLADELLREPELLKTIATWHAAALHQVDGGKPHAAQPEAVAWRPIETAPQDGYLMCYEDGAYRLKLRHEGKWLDTAYAGIECAPWGDVAVGADAQRILDMRADAGRYKLVVRDGCCENPTHWMPLPEPPGLAAPPTEPQAAQQPEAYVFAGWQQRYIDPEEGPSSWQACQDSDVRLLQGRKDYELRKVYAATPPTEPAPAEPVSACPHGVPHCWACEHCDWDRPEPSAQAGWQLVPMEATPDMCKAAVIFANGNAVYKNVASEALKIEESIYGEAYSAMLAAAPKPTEPAPQAEPAWEDASATERTHARRLLDRHCSLEVRATLSAHQEEWWRLNREREASEADILQVLAAGLSASRVEPGRVMSDAESAAAVDALRDAELPQAVPGRARDLARKLRDNVEPRSWIADAWTAGMLADFLEQVANAWNRRPAAGMVLSQSGKRSSLLGPVVIDATARWAGAKTGTDGWLFSHEAWQKFVDALSTEPPLELMTSPGVSAPESMLHARCVDDGCQKATQCPIGKCAKGGHR